MITVKCTYEDGNIITTKFNGTIEEAEVYFLGKYFNIGIVDDDFQECVKVELI